MLSTRRTLSTSRAVPMLNCELQLAMSPTPIITDAPLSATTGAGDAAGGGVRLTGGLHDMATTRVRMENVYSMNCMCMLEVQPEAELQAAVTPRVGADQRNDG